MRLLEAAFRAAAQKVPRHRELVKDRGKQRTDSTRVLAAIRGLNRLELVGRPCVTLWAFSSTVAPEWLQRHTNPEWVQRYVRRLDDHRLPKSKEERQAEAERIGADGHELLDAVLSKDAPRWLGEIPAIEVLRRVWLQNFFYDQDGTARWRTAEEGIPRAAKYVNHPIDTDARYARAPVE